MRINPSVSQSSVHQQPEPQALERDTERPKIERKPGEPFDVRKADIEIQARWISSEIAHSH